MEPDWLAWRRCGRVEQRYNVQCYVLEASSSRRECTSLKTCAAVRDLPAANGLGNDATGFERVLWSGDSDTTGGHGALRGESWRYARVVMVTPDSSFVEMRSFARLNLRLQNRGICQVCRVQVKLS